MVAALFGLLLPIGFGAETRDECLLRCAKEKAVRDLKCSSLPDPAGTSCLEKSNRDYNSEKNRCPAPPKK